MWKVTLFVCLVTVIGCQEVGFERAKNSVDRAFEPYVHAWMLNYEGSWPPGLEVRFGTPFNHEKSLADCKTRSINGEAYQYTVRVEKADWDLMALYEREALIFHELGHCVALRGHTEGGHNIDFVVDPDDVDSEVEEVSCPKSFMNTPLKGNTTYRKCRAYLYREMFKYETDSEIFWPNYKQSL